MLRLYLLRHVNTAWALPGQRDFDRELNAEGIADLEKLENWIESNSIAPGHVYCSPAKRTKATLEGVLKGMSPTPEVTFVEDFYSGYVEEYLAAITGHPAPEDLLLVGHNPTCSNLLGQLATDNSDNAPGSFPPGGMAVFDLEIEHWDQLKFGNGKLADFFHPRSSQRFEA